MIANELARSIVPDNEELNAIVSAAVVAFACVIASRKLPAPESFKVVTVNVAACAADPDSNVAATAKPPTVRARRVNLA